MVGRSPAARSTAAWVTLLLLTVRLHAAGEWQVPEATLRYKLELDRKPTHPAAGYYVDLPDGGILHGTTPATVVMTEEGKLLPSCLLWNNPESGFSIVFADPGRQARPVYVYTQPGRPAKLWRPDTGLTPSAILCAFPGRESLSAAQALGKLGRVEPVVHSANEAGIAKAPFSIGGDDTGRPRPGSFYLLSHVEAAVAGKYWIAPFIRSGQGEVLIDGTRLFPKEQSKLWGGTGAFFELTQGLHRVEVFQTAPGTGPYSSNQADGGLMYLTWRPPKEQLKGVESRVLKTSEIVRSGVGRLTAVEARDGAPVAAATARPSLCYWFENEEPLLIYELSALSAGQPAGTTWTWSFPEGATLEGATVKWLFPGFRESKVKLTVKSGQSTSTCAVSFFGFGTQQTSLEKPAHREAFRSVLATMLQAYPRNPDPVADWSEAWWNNLLRTTEGGEGYPLLLRLFTDHLEAARKKLAPGQLQPLQDLFLDLTQRQNPREALGWLQKFQPGPAAAPRQTELKLREGELQMYYLGDRKQAEQIFTALAGLSTEYGERAKIRLGDLAFLEGDLNKATSLYADVQNRARSRRNATPPLPGGLVANQLVEGGAVRPAAPDWRSSPLALQNPPKTAGAPARTVSALQEVSLSENVRTLTEGNFILEARQALAEWESEFPLSKISGDYIIHESALYMKTEDWKRARPMLEAYCREIDASSFLPDAASMLIACVKGAKEPPASIRDIIEKVKGRLKYHPVASELDQFLSTAK
ncbi:MAG: hypothetical protein QOE70_5733 [Chthoniobacter sp.]|jgi:hypothetical protein|nr:hypothetical protein [Chthoniobacter sp.]